MTEPNEQSGSVRSQRTALAILGLVAAIAVGFGLGFLANQFLHDDTATPVAGSVDVGFAQDMIEHHDQAVEMSAIALANASDPLVRDFAYDILTTQQNQIGQMTGWLSLWDQPIASSAGHMAWMSEGSDGHDHGGTTASATAAASPGSAQMPGMATSEEMAALRQARGEAVDVLFLQLMLRHHQGGLPMMEYAAEHAQERVVRTLAQTMVDTQQSESARMTQLLSEKGAAPLPAN
ncbi:DUF305 domain-containing protein [Rhodococcus sp. NPDC003318]|uniref:DUF305 domain-containing protein n=1 Tax=Rhodococcus sp. NPDC003318 TaxID=3364503 RepID=UPI0036BDA2C0